MFGFKLPFNDVSAFGFAILFMLMLMFAAPVTAARVTIAVASNFTPTLRTLSQHFAETCACEINIVSGSSGKLYFQITQGAPFDAFFSADESTPRRLLKEGHALNDSYFIYGLGMLAIAGETDLHKATKIAVANPKLAPYGKAALEYIDSLKNANEIKSKLVYAENVSQAFQFVSTGAAQTAFVPWAFSTNNATNNEANKRMFTQLPVSSYSPIQQAAVIIKDSPTTRKFFAFVQSADAQTLIKNAGYTVNANAQ